ncbi:RNA polymerase rpb3 rpb11 dimerization domain-containing protein [Cyclospora cayetanensis]|uniref:RNA polymerase rpb3 rpb11 dimerization domain-containing protein n=1 Tax=Cyclospora cayetanensis TaxID=88456 RepID=A0A1D3DAJ7_9EIME|nr:RNA polymerase rpb3 rpb11 dimerization domain-containing protein [Cyclospora cayetanensis]
MECPDPKEQLVVEIWSSRKATPKEVLLHALREVQLAAASARSQLREDVDWAEEERALQAGWKHISRHKEAERQQELQGGPPVFIFDAKGDFRPADPESAAKALPLTPPPVNPTEVSELR